MEFKRLPNDLFVGYHVEGGETFVLGGEVPLSMTSLHDDRPLYLSNHNEHWFPKHLPDEEFRVYEIHFTLPKQKTYYHYGDYMDINPAWDDRTKQYDYSKQLKKLIEQGIHLFSVDEDNDMGEIPESFIIYPTRYVKDIVRIN